MMHDESTHSERQPAEERPAGYGMTLFGEETAYLSHLPMFMSPHNYQAIFEVTLSKAGADPLAAYVEDRRAHPEFNMYGWEPVHAFVLTDLVSPDPQHPKLSSFDGNIWRGHFESFHVHEKPGSAVPGLDDIVANVTNVVLFRRLDPTAQTLPQLEYFLFGKGQELFLAHAITSPPDFDQILGVQVESHQFTDDELRQGLPVTFPGRANSEDQKIQEGEEVSGQVQVPGQNGPQALEGLCTKSRDRTLGMVVRF